MKWVLSVITSVALVLLATRAIHAQTQQRYQAETFVRSGQFAGSIQSPFAGMAVYANGDQGKTTISTPTIPGKYSFTIFGASNNGNPASITLYSGTASKGSTVFTSITGESKTIQVTITEGTQSQEMRLVLENDNGSSDTYIDYVDVSYVGPIVTLPAPNPPSTGAFTSKQYRNMFLEAGKTQSEITAKVESTWNQMFYGNDATERVYYPVGFDMAYIKDVGNGDVRSEGMSYGMMIAVQLNKKEEFKKLWKFSKTYLQHQTGPRKGYFAWQARTDGVIIDPNPASDGEEYFATALLFAARRWGNETGIFNYEAEAQAILDVMLHKEEQNQGVIESVVNMFNPTHKMVVFTPYANAAMFTDASYHLPAFYELWGRLDKDVNDRQFWLEAAQVSRQFFKNHTHQTTGLSSEYAEFSGAPRPGEKGDFRFDAWRVATNIAMDYHWFAPDPWEKDYANRIQSFFTSKGVYGNQYTMAGQTLSTDHSPGLVASNATASLAATNSQAWNFVEEFWNTPVPSGQWRYYDGMLYMLSLLHMSGNFRIYDIVRGDANNDGKVDGIDYAKWLINYGRTTIAGASVGDFDGNGKVDGVDYTAWLLNYGYGR